MTRERKLEAALREARRWIELRITGATQYDILGKIDAALATPPTSEWNEAIEASLAVCEAMVETSPRKQYQEAAQWLRNRICALKRKERP